jgi:hypothetical protein
MDGDLLDPDRVPEQLWLSQKEGMHGSLVSHKKEREPECFGMGPVGFLPGQKMETTDGADI